LPHSGNVLECDLKQSASLFVGKAYAIFKTKSAADSAISKINSGLVVGGRYLTLLLADLLDEIYYYICVHVAFIVLCFKWGHCLL
jgi:hypothetical protein